MHVPSKYSTFALAGLFAVALLFTSCDNDDDEVVDEAPLATISFGALYNIDFTAEGPPPLNEQMPFIAGDSLLVAVAYSGCSGDHEFEMRYRLLTARRAEVWLYKLTPDEACQAVFAPRFTFALPAPLLTRDRIDLIGPNSVSYTLR